MSPAYEYQNICGLLMYFVASVYGRNIVSGENIKHTQVKKKVHLNHVKDVG